jgi:hypothetical protein
MATPTQQSTQHPAQQPASPAAQGDAEVTELKQQLKEGRLDGLRAYMARTRAERDWQDRLYVLERVAPQASLDTLQAACAAEPEAADLLVIRCAHFAQLAKTMRGGGTCDQVGQARFLNSAECVKAALADMAKSTQMDAEDPTACTLLLAPLTIFSQHDLQRQAFDKATALAPGLAPAYFAVTNALTERWGGSHKASVDFAREALKKAGPGSDMATCLFWAHAMVRSHYREFDKDERAAKLYGQNPDVREELNAAFDKWLAPPYAARRSSLPFLKHASYWYQVAWDQERLNRAIALTGEEVKPRAQSAPTAARPAATGAKGGGLLGRIFGGG